MKHRYIISSCLLGEKCKYNGGDNYHEELVAFLKDKEYIAVCPERLAELPCPRPCCEINGGKVIDENGIDVSAKFRLGVTFALKKAITFGGDIAILQPRSPSCGVGFIYSGTFDHSLVVGDGWFVKALKDAGIKTVNVDEFIQNLEVLEEKHKSF